MQEAKFGYAMADMDYTVTALIYSQQSNKWGENNTSPLNSLTINGYSL